MQQPDNLDADFSSESRYSHAEGEENTLCHMIDSEEHGLIGEAVSAEWAAKIAAALNRPMDPVTGTKIFFEKIIPTPDAQNFSTQLGVHFEEVREMVEELVGTDEETIGLLTDAGLALHNLSQHLKKNVNVVSINNRIEYVDALCDQIVTAVGCAHMAGMDISGAMQAVNAANESKLVDGEAIFDENRKFQKGPNYKKADLSPFV